MATGCFQAGQIALYSHHSHRRLTRTSQRPSFVSASIWWIRSITSRSKRRQIRVRARGDDLFACRQVMPDEFKILRVRPALLDAQLIERELAIFVGIFLRRDRASGFVIVDFVGFGRGIPREPVDVALDAVGFVPVLQLHFDPLFQPKRAALAKRMVALVIVGDALAAERKVMAGADALADDLDFSVPVLFPFALIEMQQVFQRCQLRHLQVAVKLFERFMHALAHKSFDAFRLGANIVHVAELVFPRALLKGFDAGIGIHYASMRSARA